MPKLLGVQVTDKEKKILIAAGAVVALIFLGIGFVLR